MSDPAARKPGPALLKLRVTPAAEKNIRSGHPWVFSNSVQSTNRESVGVELGVIFDRRDQFLAVGFFDPNSPIAFRVIHHGKPRKIDMEFWRERIEECFRRRTEWFDASTTGYRLIHGESDGFPGLVLDRCGSTLVVKLYSSAWFEWLDRIVALFVEEMKSERVVLRLSRNILEAASRAGLREGSTLRGAEVDRALFLENETLFEAEVLRGQKTGFFLDQRDNRQKVAGLSAGKTVLNLFSFSGGFSVCAARAGALAVTDVDISQHALDSARRNMQLNEASEMVRRCRHETVKADIFEWLRSAEGMFDVVVIDPPSMAKSEAERPRALSAYRELIGQGMRRVAPGGWLIAASCSAHVRTDEFIALVESAAGEHGQRFSVKEVTSHPIDHAFTFREGEYLKCVYVKG